jgi:nicotinate-nucleotide adenylyltransferase
VLLRIGVLGGTFDPVHLGHLASARQVAAALALEEVLLVLCPHPYHKSSHTRASIAHRWAMLRAATEDDPLLMPCDVELGREGPTYTVDTLETLRQDLPRAELHLILGIDAYVEIDTWHRPERLLELAHIVVTTRPGHDLPAQHVLPPIAARSACCYDSRIGRHRHSSGHLLLVQPLDGLDISSSEIRSIAATGSDVDHLTGASVGRYIRQHDLYRRGSSI